MPNVTVQLSLRIDPGEYEEFLAAANQADLSMARWLIRCAREALQKKR